MDSKDFVSSEALLILRRNFLASSSACFSRSSAVKTKKTGGLFLAKFLVHFLDDGLRQHLGVNALCGTYA